MFGCNHKAVEWHHLTALAFEMNVYSTFDGEYQKARSSIELDGKVKTNSLMMDISMDSDDQPEHSVMVS